MVRISRMPLGRTLLLAALGFVAPTCADACQICIAYPQKSAADILIESPCVVFAREGPDEAFSYAPVEVLKGDAEGKPIGLFLDSQTRRLLADFPERVVVLAYDANDQRWRNLGLADESYTDIVRQLLELAPRWQEAGGDNLRVDFFLPLFGHENPLIYELAYLELARAPYGAIKRLSRSVPPETIDRILKRPQYFQWKSLAILMRAYGGDEEDKRYIQESFRTAERFGLTTNLAAWAAATIELEGAEAVSFIQATYFENPDRNQDELLEVIKAVSMHGTEGRTELRDQIVKAYEILLDVHPDMGGYVAKDFIAWNREDLADQVVARALPDGNGATNALELRWSDLLSQESGSLVSELVKLPGYVLPLEASDGLVTEFLLVPYVGACIHTPPPPPNQIVYVTAPDGVLNRGLFAPLWVTGQILQKETTNRLFLVDGSANITAGYVLDTSGVDDYSAAESNVLAAIEVPATSLHHSWWQNVQILTSIHFSRTMTDIRDRRTVLPLLFGLLVAFAYGVIHTLGPGHGKAVVVSYFIGEGGSLLRGIRFGTQIAVIHVLAAVVVAILADFAIRQTTGVSPGSFRFVRLASYAVIVAIGATMLVGAVRSSGQGSDAHDHEHTCGYHHPGKEKGTAGFGFLSLAIGAVPCTGALMVLLYGVANDLLWPCVLMVVAISAGMAVAMSSIGIAAILGRRFVENRLDHRGRGQQRVVVGLRVTGAAFVLLLGLALLGFTLWNGFSPFESMVSR